MNTRFKRAHSNDESKRSPSRRKCRNENEKRRRDLFSQLVLNLEEILNIDKKTVSNDQTAKTTSPNNKLDKASILRETATYLRKHHQNLSIQSKALSPDQTTTVDRTNDLLDLCWKPPPNLVTTEEWIQIAIEAMNCFFLVAKCDPYNGQIVYVSKNISSLLNYSQNEILNRSLFELILARDHDQLRDYLLKDHKVLETCNISWRRATDDEYEQCTIIGAFRQVNIHREENDEKYLMSIVKVNTLDKTLIINNDDSINEFTTRLNLQGRFIHIDSKAREFLGYTSYELIGHTYFDFVHPDDLPIIIRAHQLWKQNGTGKSDPYRFLTKGQQWIFLQTNCQVQINSWTGKPESYLCTTNSLQNSIDSLPRHVSSRAVSSLMAMPSVQSPAATSPQRRSSSTDTQITSFLSHLGNITYRTNIREKLNEHRTRKEAEIRVRYEEIKVIEDIIQFINEFESKNSTTISTRSIPPTTTTVTAIDLTSDNNQRESLRGIMGFESSYDPTLLQSPLTGAIEDFSPQPSPMVSHHILSTDNPYISTTKDEIINDPITCSLLSPQQGTFNIPSPTTPFSIPSRPSPMTPAPFSVSPMPSSPFPHTLSPSTSHTATHDINNQIPPPPPPSLSSSTSNSSSSSSSSSSTATTNPNKPPTEQTSKTSSFNRSLPHSLVS